MILNISSMSTNLQVCFDLADWSVAPTDIEEVMPVAVDWNQYKIHIPLPPKIFPTLTMM